MEIQNRSNLSVAGKEGFTLIEVMMVMVVLSIGILAVASMQITAFQGNKSARLRTEAIALASEKIEALMNQGYSALPGIPAADRTETIGEINLSWTLTDNPDPTLELRELTVTASWNDASGSQVADVSCLIYNSD